LSESLLALSGGLAPEIFASEITETAAPAVFERLRAGEDCHLGSLYAAPGERGDPLACIPLLLLKGEVPHLLPGAEMTLETGDRVLFAAGLDAPRRLEARLFDAELLHYLETGEQLSHHPLFRRPPRRQTG
jgi:hypothetical protein